MPTIKGKWGVGRPGPDASLQEHIGWLVHEQDYQVVTQTEMSAQLVRPKKFSVIWALLWFLVFGIGLLVYILYYMAKPSGSIYLFVENGQVFKR